MRALSKIGDRNLDSLIVETDPLGSMMKSKFLGGPEIYELTTIDELQDGSLLLGGAYEIESFPRRALGSRDNVVFFYCGAYYYLDGYLQELM